MTYEDIIFEKKDGIARITINRPEKYNAARQQTVHELIDAFNQCMDPETGVVVFTGAGDMAFCTGGDQSTREKGGYQGKYMLPLEVGWQTVTHQIRTLPKPVIARLNGFAIGGGHVWHVACDLSIAADKEKPYLGQAGPRVGSFDPGFGTGDLMRAVGIKRAKEIWYLCRRYTAREALAMGLVNAVVPMEKLDEEVDKWCKELLEKSPTALKMLKYAFLAETDGTTGATYLGIGGLGLFYGTEEAVEGKNAFLEKRKPNFREKMS
ncbi:MAG: 1,4-dihydroxy-2-naphthoyl-CoA synthase [Candidatus Lokiarchaeota archaeon]|nr:1,4-dihydroxy-2-naphthoyl-CoA synthase [Candidatus Lokiarchaeota archaeon]